MKRQWILRIVGALAALGVVSAAWMGTSQVAGAGDPAVTAAMGTTLAAYAPEEPKEAEKAKKVEEPKEVEAPKEVEKAKEAEEVKFVGGRKCKMCHVKVYKSWEETLHGKSMDSLKPGEAKEAKEKAKLDPEKDYTKDKGCLACHATGLGKPGGFELKDDEMEMAKVVKALGNVGCEVCHGPGEKYVAFHKSIKKEKKQYTPAEMKEAGTVSAGEECCKTCHNEKSPTYKEFKMEEAVKTGIHDKPGLKYRKESQPG